MHFLLTSWSRTVAAVTVVVWVLLTAGCGDPQEVIQSGTMGTNGEVRHILLRNVHVAETEDPYRPGDNAIARLMLFNESHAEDALIGASSPQARQVVLRWDRSCDGQAETVPQVPLLPEGTAPDVPGQRGESSPYHLEIVGFTQIVRPGTTFPIRLEFERAGTVTIDAKVQATRDGDQPPPPACWPR